MLKKTIDFVKIKDLDDTDFEIGLSLLLTRIVNLLGIKEAVSDLNKQDIVEMLDIGFKNLSLQEVNYAFKLERYNQLEPKTEHLVIFNLLSHKVAGVLCALGFLTHEYPLRVIRSFFFGSNYYMSPGSVAWWLWY